MSLWDRLLGRENGHAPVTLTEQARELTAAHNNLELVQERLAELELALDAQGWQSLTSESSHELSRQALKQITLLARLAYLKSPVINRAVSLQASYVFGQGVTLKAREPAVDAIVQAWWTDRANQAELSSHQALILKETGLQLEGNIFYVLFASTVSGQVTVRTLPVDEVTDIIMNPEDRRDPWYYKREWAERRLNLANGVTDTTAKVAYYPDWQYRQAGGYPATIGGKLVLKDQPVYHRKVGGLADMRFGVPEVYAALDWAKAYKEFLEDRATVSRALSRFAQRLTTKGGAAGVAAAKARLSTTLGSGSGETNPPPVTGSTFIGTENSALEPIKVAGATIHPDEGRRFLLMAAAATGWSEQFFGDSQVGALATAKALDRPAELRIRERQLMWAEDLQALAGYVVERQRGLPRPRLAQDVDATVDVLFPPILEHDFAETVNGAVDAITLRGQAPSDLLSREEQRRVMVTVLQSVAELDEDAPPPEPDEEEPEADDGAEGPPGDESAPTEAVEADAVRVTKADVARAKAWVASLGLPELEAALNGEEPPEAES